MCWISKINEKQRKDREIEYERRTVKKGRRKGEKRRKGCTWPAKLGRQRRAYVMFSFSFLVYVLILFDKHKPFQKKGLVVVDQKFYSASAEKLTKMISFSLVKLIPKEKNIIKRRPTYKGTTRGAK